MGREKRARGKGRWSQLNEPKLKREMIGVLGDSGI